MIGLLKEARIIISLLQTYGSIHPVKGVVYPEGTYEEILDRAREWMDNYDKANKGTI